MTPATAYALSTMLTQLCGRDVAFSQRVKPLPNKARSVFGTYTTMPHPGTLVVKADLALLGSFAGALVMLPNEVVTSRIKELPLEELLRDAIHEVLNVTSTCLAAQGRVVFQEMHLDQNLLSEPAQAVFRTPGSTTYFDVTVKGYTGGQFTVVASA